MISKQKRLDARIRSEKYELETARAQLKAIDLKENNVTRRSKSARQAFTPHSFGTK